MSAITVDRYIDIVMDIIIQRYVILDKAVAERRLVTRHTAAIEDMAILILSCHYTDSHYADTMAGGGHCVAMQPADVTLREDGYASRCCRRHTPR